MWKKLERFYEEDSYVEKAKVDSQKGKFEEMRMMENEKIEQ